MPFKTIYLFGGSAAGNLVINDNTAWLRVYAEVICGAGDDCVPAASVNFASSTVLAVFAGWRPTAGYEVNITQVRVENSVILVKTILTAPGPTCLVAQMITQPGHVVTIPKTELPVTFETEPTQCSC